MLLINTNSQTVRPYIGEQRPLLRKLSIENWNNLNILLDIHFELQFRTQKTSVINLIAQIEERLKEIVQTNWGDSESLQEIQNELIFEGTRFSIDLNQEIIERLLELESFRWISIEAKIGAETLEIRDWGKTGLLSSVGYEVGQNGLNEKSRRAILDAVYTREIPKNLKIKDLEKWGKPKTGIRLKKLADCLASFTRNEKRNYVGDYRISISEREADLKYLKKKYYDGKYDFGFPTTTKHLSKSNPI